MNFLCILLFYEFLMYFIVFLSFMYFIILWFLLFEIFIWINIKLNLWYTKQKYGQPVNLINSKLIWDVMAHKAETVNTSHQTNNFPSYRLHPSLMYVTVYTLKTCLSLFVLIHMIYFVYTCKVCNYYTCLLIVNVICVTGKKTQPKHFVVKIASFVETPHRMSP